MAQQPPLDYEQFVIVAEDQHKIYFPLITDVVCPGCGSAGMICNNCECYCDFGSTAAALKFSLFLAGFEWEFTFSSSTNSISLEFKGFARGRVNEMHLEVLLCDENFKPLPNFPMRQLLTTDPDSSAWKYTLPTKHECVNMTVRVLKDRPFFPDFTSKDVRICGQKSNGKLRIGDHVFHVNKEFLAAFSPYFNVLFNGNFDEAKQDVVELKGEVETNYPELFHVLIYKIILHKFKDFLLTICLPSNNFQDALPNAQNVAGLLALAQSYQVDLVRDKCERHLKFCREMPAADRFVLAKKYGLKDVLNQIVREQKTLEDCQELIYAYLDEEL